MTTKTYNFAIISYETAEEHNINSAEELYAAVLDPTQRAKLEADDEAAWGWYEGVAYEPKAKAFDEGWTNDGCITAYWVS